MTEQRDLVVEELRTPRAAALAGIVFAVVFGVVVLLLHSVETARRADWIMSESHRRTLKLALQLIPFAGIAFLWFIGVIRSRLGEREDKFFSTVFLGSGLLFVAMLFTATAVIGGLLGLFGGAQPVATPNIELAGNIARFLVGTLGTRMSAVFTLVVTNLGRRTEIMPRWLVLIGYAVALVLFVVPSRNVAVELLFPAWVLILSVHILVVSFRTHDTWKNTALAD